MLNTIRAKLIAIVLTLLLVLGFVLSSFRYIDFHNYKKLVIKRFDATVSVLAERINKEIASLESTAIDLAIVGEIQYFTKDNNIKILKKSVPDIFNNNKYSVGGGIWYKPYSLNPDVKFLYAYVYPDKNGIMKLDREFNGTYNDYISSNWYKEISSKSKSGSDVVWSTPYFDIEGSKKLMVTAGANVFVNKQFVGVSSVDWEIDDIVKTVRKMQPTKNSFTLFADKNNDFIITSTDKNLDNDKVLGSSLKSIPWYSKDLENTQEFDYNNLTYVSFVKTLDNGMLLIVNIPKNELYHYVYIYTSFMFIILVVISLIISFILYFVLNKNIHTPIQKLTDIAHKISNGSLDTEIKISKPQEFADLADTFNKMTNDIKSHLNNLNKITKEKERIESELSIAKLIQYSALPHTFYPTMSEFEIYATMDTAKEVGGDFYDFFFINPNQFMFLIADVSGKGIPAALFMMTTKTLIKNLAIEGYSPKELIEKINNRVCETNEQGFFITMFASIIDITTGQMTYINCGHNPPLVKRADGQYEYLNIPANLVLGAMENVQYSFIETKFNEGDMIFLYTDGITEAQNSEEKLYGEERLLQCLNKSNGHLTDVLTAVKYDVADYVQEMEQSDDMTMLAFRYNGNSEDNTKIFECKAEHENYNKYLEWLNGVCDEFNIPQACRMKLELISEELYVNIANYAYNDNVGNVEVKMVKLVKDDNKIKMQFIDSGVKYNPLEKQDPDITLSAEERPIGGLGIFMVKQYVDSIEYTYEDNKNILTFIVSY